MVTRKLHHLTKPQLLLLFVILTTITSFTCTWPIWSDRSRKIRHSLSIKDTDYKFRNEWKKDTNRTFWLLYRQQEPRLTESISYLVEHKSEYKSFNTRFGVDCTVYLQKVTFQKNDVWSFPTLLHCVKQLELEYVRMDIGYPNVEQLMKRQIHKECVPNLVFTACDEWVSLSKRGDSKVI